MVDSVPSSPQSLSSELSGSPPRLDPGTLALLQAHWDNQAAAMQSFAQLEQEAQNDKDDREKKMMSVDRFRELFGEDWQLSQFWYSAPFATRLAKFVRQYCTENTKVAFLCSPTAYVGFQHTNPLPGTKLFEVDDRFRVVGGCQFVHYDIDEPEDVPDELKGTFDIIVADPPFLNEVTNRKLATSLRLLLHPTQGRLILLTSTSVEHLFPSIYHSTPIGPLQATGLKVEHANNLANDFKCWSSWEIKCGELELE